MNQVTLSQLAAVPYLDIANIGGRRVNLMALWDGDRWHMWIPTPAGLINMHPVEAMHVDYVAKAPARPNDLLIPFVELMWQRHSTKSGRLSCPVELMVSGPSVLLLRTKRGNHLAPSLRFSCPVGSMTLPGRGSWS